MVDSMFIPSWAQNSCIWLFLVIFVSKITRTKEKNNFQSSLGTVSLVCLSQPRGGCGENSRFLVILTTKLDYFSLQIWLKIPEIIKLELRI